MPIARGLMERSQPISSRQPASLLATLRRCPSGKAAASSRSLETSIPTVGSICAISSVPALWCELLALATVRVHEEETARAHAHPRIGTLVGYVLRAGPGDRVDTDLPATTLWHLLKTQGGGEAQGQCSGRLVYERYRTHAGPVYDVSIARWFPRRALAPEARHLAKSGRKFQMRAIQAAAG